MILLYINGEYGNSLNSATLRFIRKSAPGICVNKDEDQLRCDRTADKRLCFRYLNYKNIQWSTISLLLKPLAIFCCCTAQFVLDLPIIIIWKAQGVPQ